MDEKALGSEGQMADELAKQKQTQELRKATAEAASAEAAAIKALREASTLDLKTEVPAETLTTPDKASPVSEVIAYAELAAAGAAVVGGIQTDLRENLDGKRVLIVRSADVTKDHATYLWLRSTRERLQNALRAAAERLEPPADPASSNQIEGAGEQGTEPVDAAASGAAANAGVPLAGVLMGANPLVMGVTALSSLVPTFLSLARSNTTVRGRDVSLKESAVLAAVANQLLNLNARVTLAGFAPAPAGGVLSGIVELQRTRDEVADARSWWKTRADAVTTRLAAAQESLAGLRKTKATAESATPPPNLDAEIQRLESEIEAATVLLQEAQTNVAAADRLIAETDAFITVVHTESTGGGMPSIVAAAVLEDFLSEEGFIVFAESAFAGGESNYEETVGRDKVQHVGGVVVSFLVSNTSGRMRSAGVVTRIGTSNHKIGASGFDYEGDAVPPNRN